jgi:2-hydroxychromene-2-carboxylate isomerase
MEFWFFYGSTYTYLTINRIDAAATAAGVTVEWKPFNVTAIMTEQNNSPFRNKPVKAAYMWRDIERRAARFGLPFAAPGYYPGADAELLCNHVGMVAIEQGWGSAFSRAAYHAWFIRGERLGAPETVRNVISNLGHDPETVLARANAPDIIARYQANTDQARAHGIFGSPSFKIDDEIFWGDDRLEDALDWATSRHPTPPTSLA